MAQFSKVFFPYDPLPAQDLNDMVGFMNGIATGVNLEDESVTPEKRSGGFWGGKISILSTGALTISDPNLDFTPKMILCTSTRTQNTVHFSSGYASINGSGISQGCSSLGISFGVVNSDKAFYAHVDGSARFEAEVVSFSLGEINLNVSLVNHSSYGEWLIQAFG